MAEQLIDSIPYEDTIISEKLTEYLGWTVSSLLEKVHEDDYEKEWPQGMSQYVKELYAYSVGGMDGHDKFYHMINAIKMDLPHVEMTKDGYINTTFLLVIKELCDNPDLGIAGAASSGKTFPVACFILEDWKCAPNKTLSFVCTTTLGASEDRIWGAIVGLFQRSRYKVGDYIAHKYMIVWGAFSDDASDRTYNSAIKALGIEKGEEGRKAIDTTRGRKQERVRIVFDELPEMGNFVTLALVNLESNIDLRAVYIGNPARQEDAHGEVCKPDHVLGYKSINKATPKWKTRTGVCIFMNGEWSPNFQAPVGTPIPFPYLTNRNTLKKMLKRCHGNRESIEYYRNAIGFWPSGAVIDTILTREILESYGSYIKHKWQQNIARKKVAGFDTGFTLGGDKCVLQIGELGTNIEHRKIVQWLKQIVIMPPAHGVFEEEVAKLLVNYLIEERITPDCFGMDISSDGGKIMREVIRYWLSRGESRAANIVPISSMGKPTDRIVSSVDLRKCSDAFDRRVTEYWMMVREGIMSKCITGMPDEDHHPMIDEFCLRIYDIKSKKFSIETKPDMKERVKQSPDHADAFSYMIEMARRHGLMFISPDDEERRSARKYERLHEEANTDDPEGHYYSDSWGEDEEYVA